jgi:hypothetical protein
MSLTLKSSKPTLYSQVCVFPWPGFHGRSLISVPGVPLPNLHGTPAAKVPASEMNLIAFLDGLLPGIWNAPDRGTCTLFYVVVN